MGRQKVSGPKADSKGMAKMITVSLRSINETLSLPSPEFPRYTGQLMNLANQNAQGTRPRIVGQMSELIQEFDGRRFDQWVSWYNAKHPEAIREATGKVLVMLQNLKQALELIDESMVEAWIKDLVLAKTFAGFRFQEAILKSVAATLNTQYRIADRYEESQGIDGYIGEQPVSIKPVTYRLKGMLAESIRVPIIYYEKTNTGLKVDYSELSDLLEA